MILEYPWTATDISLPIEQLIPFQKDLGDDFILRLRSQISTQLRDVVSLHSHGQTPERPSRNKFDPKPSTEHWVDRNSNKLIICIGESFTWTEGLYGLASGGDPPIVNTLYQNFLTSHGRLAARYKCDLRSVTYPGNANSLMIECLDRVLEEIQKINRWDEILVLQQFTDRSRCEVGHEKTPWMTEFLNHSNWRQESDISKVSFYCDQELLLIKKLIEIKEKHNNLPAKFFVWRNFNPWIIEWNNSWPLVKISLSMDEFKHVMQGANNFDYSIQCAPGFYSHALSLSKNQEELLWIEKEITCAEYHFNFHTKNEFSGHPTPAGCMLWAEYLYGQGFKFSNE